MTVIKYNNIDELFNSLPTTVLLVGNGECKNSGDLIDSYEYVIRFNDFQIINYEQHVGTKIDAISFHTWDLNRKDTKNLHNNYNRYNGIVPIFTLQNGHRLQPQSQPQLLSLPKVKKYNIISQSYYTQILSQDPPIKPNGTRLSSGVGLALSLALFYNKNIHLIGFDFMKTGHYYNPYHEHSYDHNVINERQIIEKISTIIIVE